MQHRKSSEGMVSSLHMTAASVIELHQKDDRVGGGGIARIQGGIITPSNLL